MREIKFRAKRLDNGEWIYGDYHKRAGGEHCIIKMEPDENGKVVYVVHQVAPDTIGQFTGLHDKNGEEIYEGDILRGFKYPFYDAEADAYNYYAVVDWDADEAQFYAYKDLARGTQVRGISCGVCVDMEDLREMEVIGNIYDNLGLLKA